MMSGASSTSVTLMVTVMVAVSFGRISGRYHDGVGILRLVVQSHLGAQLSGSPVDGERIRIRPAQGIRQNLGRCRLRVPG